MQANKTLYTSLYKALQRGGLQGPAKQVYRFRLRVGGGVVYFA